jgi:hypothetical protein
MLREKSCTGTTSFMAHNKILQSSDKVTLISIDNQIWLKSFLTKRFTNINLSCLNAEMCHNGLIAEQCNNLYAMPPHPYEVFLFGCDQEAAL